MPDELIRYPPIADHGMVGDLQTAALVTSHGVVDWWCAPRFDSPSVFAALLDHDRGGYFSITADAPEPTTRQLYLPDTAILVTRFMTEGGVGEVIDFMPVDRPHHVTDRHKLVRLMRVARGTVTFALECRPRFDYGRVAHGLGLDASGEFGHFTSRTWTRICNCYARATRRGCGVRRTTRGRIPARNATRTPGPTPPPPSPCGPASSPPPSSAPARPEPSRRPR